MNRIWISSKMPNDFQIYLTHSSVQTTEWWLTLDGVQVNKLQYDPKPQKSYFHLEAKTCWPKTRQNSCCESHLPTSDLIDVSLMDCFNGRP